MPSQKLENLLNLALQASTRERENSQVLSVGFTPATRTWELIVKYHGSLEAIESNLIHIEPLIFGYAIVTIREDLIESFAQLDEVEFIEKPKSLYFDSIKYNLEPKSWKYLTSSLYPLDAKACFNLTPEYIKVSPYA